MARETARGRAISQGKRRHGHKLRGRESPEYRTWCSIIRRCHNPNASGYQNYGAKGTTVCERWRSSFEAFFEDMGRRPSAKHSIDRMDSTGHYEPGNCRWATMPEQQRNRSSNHMIEHAGRTMCLTDWADEAGLLVHTLRKRIVELGWSMERALATPVQQRSPRGLRAKASAMREAMKTTAADESGKGRE